MGCTHSDDLVFIKGGENSFDGILRFWIASFGVRGLHVGHRLCGRRALVGSLRRDCRAENRRHEEKCTKESSVH